MLITNDQDRLREWFKVKVPEGNHDEGFIFIGKEIRNDLVAVVGYSHYSPDTASIYAHIAGEVGKNWLTKDFLWFMFAYPFVQLDCEVIFAPVFGENSRCIKFLRHIGFQLMEVKRNSFNGKDVHIFGMFRPMCRFLNLKTKLHKEVDK